MVQNRDYIANLKTAADPLRIASALGLRGRGKRFFCPACQPDGGKTPDLALGGKGFTCHKCGRKGDLLVLIELAAGLDFKGAVAWLEQETGLRREKAVGKAVGHHRPALKSALKPPCKTTGAVLPIASPQKPQGTAHGAVLGAFLAACRPIAGEKKVLDWLKAKGCAPDVADRLDLRFCGREYKDIMAELERNYGTAALLEAELLKPSKKSGGRPVGTFWHYYASKAGFLVIPYLVGGCPVFLKTRPPVSKLDAERLGLVRFLNTGGMIPCLYNVDAIYTDKNTEAPPDKVLICEGESDTWAALSAGYVAVGTPGANSFKSAWVELFRSFQTDGRSRVYLALDADKAGDDGARIIAGLFRDAGLPVPLRINLPDGQDVAEYLK
jgi:5S rRNA maturation endonuclease (ribonuclease M5)